MPASKFDERVRQALPRAAEVLAVAIRKNAPTTRIRSNVTVGQLTSPHAGAYQIEVVVKAPEALAFEFGSGLHHPKRPDTYEIRPKNVKTLAFFWDKVDENSPTGPKFRGISPTSGKALFTFVDHPGVAARPYNMKSIQEKADEMRQIIGHAFSVQVVAELGAMLEVK